MPAATKLEAKGREIIKMVCGIFTLDRGFRTLGDAATAHWRQNAVTYCSIDFAEKRYGNSCLKEQHQLKSGVARIHMINPDVPAAAF